MYYIHIYAYITLYLMYAINIYGYERHVSVGISL